MFRKPGKITISLALLVLSCLPIVAQAQLYGVSLNGHSSGSPGSSSLYSINPGSGAGTLIGTDLGYAVNSLAVDPTTGLMYAATTTWSGETQILSPSSSGPCTSTSSRSMRRT
jgi:hypothetical protein